MLGQPSADSQAPPQQQLDMSFDDALDLEVSSSFI